MVENVSLGEINRNILELAKRMELLQNIIMAEGDLTDWAQGELQRARKRPETEYVLLEDSKKRILAKK